MAQIMFSTVIVMLVREISCNYFGSNGDAVTGLRHYGNNKLEYYGTDHVQYRNRYASQGNQFVLLW